MTKIASAGGLELDQFDPCEGSGLNPHLNASFNYRLLDTQHGKSVSAISDYNVVSAYDFQGNIMRMFTDKNHGCNCSCSLLQRGAKGVKGAKGVEGVLRIVILGKNKLNLRVTINQRLSGEINAC